MSKSYKPEEATVSMLGETVKGCSFEEITFTVGNNSLPPITIILNLPNGKQTGVSLNTGNLIRKIQELYPLQFKEFIKDLKC